MLVLLWIIIVSASTPSYPPIDPSSIQVINANISVYVPWQYCLPENCPQPLGTCNYTSNTCEFNAPYNGIATYPKAYVTYYCTLEPSGCLPTKAPSNTPTEEVPVEPTIPINVPDSNVGAISCITVGLIVLITALFVIFMYLRSSSLVKKGVNLKRRHAK